MKAILQKLYLNSIHQSVGDINNVLILYEEKISFLGDCCLQFNKFKYVKSLLNNASIHINFSDKRNEKFYDGLLKNNPYLDQVTGLTDWAELQFDKYDVIFCVSYNENDILSHLSERYGDSILGNLIKLTVYSISDMLLQADQKAKYVFPVNRPVNNFLKLPKPGELYLSKDEILAADSWLESNGIKPTDDLYIMLDSTSSKDKLINIEVYFDILKALTRKKDARILVFDEKNIGKRTFYEQWLNEEQINKIIFSKGQTLREDLGLLGSSYTKMIFGPCTGLMHCSSSIFNSYVNSGMSLEKVPLMIVYTGEYKAENLDAGFWWGSSPLINCLMLLKHGDNKELTELDPEVFDPSVKPLPCSEYTTEILLDYISR